MIPREKLPSNYGDNYSGVVLIFDGPVSNDYQLFARSKVLHGDKPVLDDPFGPWVWVDDPNGREVKRVDGKWVRDKDGRYVRGRYERRPRRTWTKIGGYERGTMKSRTQANTRIDIVESDLPGPGPWQAVIDVRTDHSSKTKSNMIDVEFEPPKKELSRFEKIVAAIKTFQGRRTRSGCLLYTSPSPRDS